MKIDELSNLFLQEEKNIDKLYTLIQKYKLEILLPEILKNLKKKKNLMSERKKVIIESPFELSDETIREIESRYEEKIGVQKIDKDIIIGFKLKTKDKVVDSSLKALFKNFTK